MKAMAFGTFDLLHKGHEFYLKKAKKYGHLTVVVARDLTVKKVKGHFPRHNEQRRLEAVKKLAVADDVMLGNLGDPLKVVEDVRPDILCFGYDQRSFTEDAMKKLRERGLLVETVRIQAHMPHVYKSSKLGED
ncbi:adenylyltransferase/cytidyltransferase family protein [Candidatus Woesearchaeota archaeon]|nr:adenylyltransferase/cytidyltransferase family protein [Candidatus Woesearchaeota archaeon]